MMKGALCLLLIGFVNLAMASTRIVTKNVSIAGDTDSFVNLGTVGDVTLIENSCGDLNTTHLSFSNKVGSNDLNTTNHLSFSNKVGSNVTWLNVDKITRVSYKTLGVSLAHHDYEPNGGLSPPHIHPHATEVLVVVRGGVYAGFVTPEPENRLVAKVLKAGDVFVFPAGLLHFQSNIGNTSAAAITSYDNRNPGLITIANAAFGLNPPIIPDLLSKAFQLDKSVIKHLQTQF